MLKEDYCSYKIAKLLKEKGFDEKVSTHYLVHPSGFSEFFNKKDEFPEPEDVWLKCPTFQMAMKWLREVYHIEIYITFGFPFIDGKQQYKYFWSIVRVCDSHLEYPMDDPGSASYNEEMADSYEEAVEAALKYSLENLI